MTVQLVRKPLGLQAHFSAARSQADELSQDIRTAEARFYLCDAIDDIGGYRRIKLPVPIARDLDAADENAISRGKMWSMASLSM